MPGRPVMTAERVTELLGALDAHRVDACLSGGWGVDALLGEQTREHADLDSGSRPHTWSGRCEHSPPKAWIGFSPDRATARGTSPSTTATAPGWTCACTSNCRTATCTTAPQWTASPSRPQR
jgi:hypothetical protein